MPESVGAEIIVVEEIDLDVRAMERRIARGTLSPEEYDGSTRDALADY